MDVYLGIDVGSVSTNLICIDEKGKVQKSLYLRTNGKPIATLQQGLRDMAQQLPATIKVRGVGTTGSGRHLAGIIVGADIIKNEITTHAMAAKTQIPEARTILEIGGQDSKIILLKEGLVTDFAMNTVCAAGTGSFLDQQASRLNIPIHEFGPMALSSTIAVRVAGRCAVFAESDMIHKQQMGYQLSDILAGLCRALVRNYLNNLAKGKEIIPPVIFQGGVAANEGMKKAFEEELGLSVIVPPYYNVMGALGAAILAQRKMATNIPSKFKGFEVAAMDFNAGGFECNRCPNLCEVVEILEGSKVIARWGDHCGKWSAEIQINEVV